MAHPYNHGFTQSPQRGTLYPGQTILVNRHNVQVERYLSQGGFAHVYVVRSAVPINNNSQHVLKRIAVADQSMLKEVQKEVEVMRKLRGHPNIVEFIDASWHAFPQGGYEVFILMEFCAGGGLIDMMNRRLRERLTETEILQIFVDSCEAVAAMHNQKPPLLHRDLKIENILQASSTSYKLCDFGSAIAVSARHPSSVQELRELEADLSRTTTLQYRAPEMVDVYQRRHIDQKSDIWALGVLLYKLCYYTTPFEEHGPLAILNVQYRIPPYPVYSREMNALIASMLQELGTQRPTIFQLLNTVHQLRGTKSKFSYVAASEKFLSLTSHPTTSFKDGLQDIITSRPVPKHITNVPSATPESVTPMRRGRPVSTLLNASVPSSKEAGTVSKESKNPWLSAKPAATQDKFDEAWSIAGPSQKIKSEEPTVTGFGDSFAENLADTKVIFKPNPPLQPVSQVIPPRSTKSPRDAFDGLAGFPQAQAPPTLGEAVQSFRWGFRVPNRPPPLRVSRSPLPQPNQPARTPVSPRMSVSRTGLAAYRSPSLAVEQKYPSLEDLDRSWSSPDSVPRLPSVSSVVQPGKTVLISKTNSLNTPSPDALASGNVTTAKGLPRDNAAFQFPMSTQSSSSYVNAAARTNSRPTSTSQDNKKDVPIGSSPAKYRPSKPALARKRQSFQSNVENLSVSLPSAPKDWLTGDDTSPVSNTAMLPSEKASAPTLTDSSKPLSLVSSDSVNNLAFTRSSSSTRLNLPLPDRPARTSPSNNYAISKPPEPETADDSSSDETDGPEEISASPLETTFKRSERRQSSVHDLVGLYGGKSRLQPSKIPSPSKQTQRTYGTLIDVSVPSGSSSDFLSPSSIVPKSQAELVSRHFRSRSSSPEAKPSLANGPNKLSPKSSPISPISTEMPKDKRPQSMFLMTKSKPDAPALLQLPAEESPPKRAGRRSSISDMVNLYENLVINSNQKIPPPIAKKPPALKGMVTPIETRFPAISPTGTSFPFKTVDGPTPVKPIPRRSSTYDYFEDKLNIPKERPVFLQTPNRRLSVSPVSPVPKSFANVTSFVHPLSKSPNRRLSVSPVSPVFKGSANVASFVHPLNQSPNVNHRLSVSPISPVPKSSEDVASANPLNATTLRRSPIPLEANQEQHNDEISSPTPERPYQGVSQLISQWQRKSEEAEESRRTVVRGRGRPLRGRSIGQIGHKD